MIADCVWTIQAGGKLAGRVEGMTCLVVRVAECRDPQRWRAHPFTSAVGFTWSQAGGEAWVPEGLQCPRLRL